MFIDVRLEGAVGSRIEGRRVELENLWKWLVDKVLQVLPKEPNIHLLHRVDGGCWCQGRHAIWHRDLLRGGAFCRSRNWAWLANTLTGP